MDVRVPDHGLSAWQAQILDKRARGEELTAFERLEYQHMTAVDEPGAPMPGVTLLAERKMIEPGTLSMTEALERAWVDVGYMVKRAAAQQHRSARYARRPRCGARHRRAGRGGRSRAHTRRSGVSRDDGDGGPGEEGEVDGGAGRGGAR